MARALAAALQVMAVVVAVTVANTIASLPGAPPASALPGTLTQFALSRPPPMNAEILVGPDGNLWVDNSRISPSGVVRTFPSLTGQLMIGFNGDLWIVHEGRIRRLASDGVVGPVIHDLSGYGNRIRVGSETMFVGADGNLWFLVDANSALSKIARMTPAGGVTEFTLPPGGDNEANRPIALTMGPNGNLWYLRGSGVGRMTPAGVTTEFFNGSMWSYGGIVAAHGHIWFIAADHFSSTASLRKMNSSGTVVAEFSSQIGPHYRLALGPDGNIWQYGFSQRRYYWEHSDNAVLTTTPAGVSTKRPFSTSHLVGGPDGNIWAIGSSVAGSDPNVARVYRYELAGSTPMSCPGSGPIFTSFPTPTADSDPRGITAGPDGNLWFAEPSRGRIG